MRMEVHYQKILLSGMNFEVIWSVLVWVYFHCVRCDRGVIVVEENGLSVVPYAEVCSVVEVSQSYCFGSRFSTHILDGS